MIACMGGFCGKREGCAHYHAPARPGRQPIERLCDKGEDKPRPMDEREHLMRKFPVLRQWDESRGE